MSKLINEESIPVLLKEMSIKEKIDLLVGNTVFSSLAMPQYGIPAIRYLDGATGVNLLQYVMEMMGDIAAEKAANTEEAGDESSSESGAGAMDYVKYASSDVPVPESFSDEDKKMIEALRIRMKAARPNGEEPGCFPPGMLLGAAWNPEVVYKIGEAVAREAMAYGVDVLLGTPNTNIQRDPKNGRVFESFSEDPYLSKKLAPVFARSVQEQGMIADVKHFAANNQETLRQGINELISERALREIYLPGFEAAVKEGKAETVMSAYNSINGVPCAQNKWLLTDVLKNEWGFKGQVVSDWGAVYDQVEAFLAGNDMDMPGPRGKEKLYQAAENGIISEERLNDAVERMLRIILKAPAFTGKKYTEIDNELSRKAAYDAAAEGITLLKNDGLLPLQRGSKIALFGKLSERFMESGSGSAQVDTSKFTSLLKETARYTDTVLAGKTEEDTDVVIITAGASGQEGSDRPDMDFDPEDKVMLTETIHLAKAAGKKIILVMNVAGPVELEAYIDDIDALICVYFPGMEGARALADILFGTISPSGKLPLTFPRTYRQTPTVFNFPGENGQVYYGEGIFVGYRYYDYKDIEPLYPFGFGLSYSKFSIKDAVVSEHSYNNASEEPLRVSVKVKNEGSMEAKEVVQLYVHSVNPTLLKPEKELKGFKKVSLLPGEEKMVVFELMPEDFVSYDSARKVWIAEPGRYELQIGDSSRNITAIADVSVTGENLYGFSLYASVSYISKSEAAVCICEEIFGEKFDRKHLKNSAVYFGSVQIRQYLEASIRGIDKASEQWADMMKELEQKLLELERMHQSGNDFEHKSHSDLCS